MIRIVIANNEELINNIEKLASTIWHQHFNPIIGKAQVTYMLNKFQSKEAINRDIEKGYVYYIAFHNDIPCGYCSINLNEGLFLSKFYVLLSHRGKGIGKNLLEKVYLYANENKVNRIWLTCNKYNSNTIEIYKKLGFHIEKETITDIGNGFFMDDYIIAKDID